MEGLMKGLMNVALDAVLGDDRGNDDNRDRRQEQRDERSRSTWAEVVSGDNDESHDDKSTDYEQRPAHHAQVNRSRRNKEEETRPDWQEPQPRRNYEKEGEEIRQNNDGWETKKHSKQRHQIPRNEWDKFKRPVQEQNFHSEEVANSAIEVTDEELSDLSKALNKLWELDSNRLTPGKDYQIDCGEGKKVYQRDDMAQGTLFSWLSDDVFRRPTYSRFCSLLDNYNPEEGYKEVLTNEERQEQASFIEEISRTQPIKYLHQYLSAKGIVPRGFQEFKRTMEGLWFDLYGRGGTSGSSSAFEHVFVGEIKGRGEREVSGFHNWIQFYLEEAKGNVDYQGYIFPRRRGQVPDSETQLLTVQFEWRGVLKSVSSSFIGVSPEFEIALYTLCFYAGGEDNYIELGPYSVNVKCYRLGRDRIGSAFPIAES